MSSNLKRISMPQLKYLKKISEREREKEKLATFREPKLFSPCGNFLFLMKWNSNYIKIVLSKPIFPEGKVKIPLIEITFLQYTIVINFVDTFEVCQTFWL